MGLFDFFNSKPEPVPEKKKPTGADFSDYLKSNQVYIADREKRNGKDTWSEVHPNGLGELAVAIIQNKFPDYVKNVSTRVTADKPEGSALADYGGMGGDKINAGRIKDFITYNNGAGKYGSTWGANTDDVMEAVATLMHELYHARSDAVGRYAQGIGQDWKNMLKDAAQYNFPSMNSGLASLQNGDTLNEFLATATALKAMKAADVQPTKRWSEVDKGLQELEKKYPWLPQYINNYMSPESLDKDGTPLKQRKIEFVDPAYQDPFGDTTRDDY